MVYGSLVQISKIINNLLEHAIAKSLLVQLPTKHDMMVILYVWLNKRKRPNKVRQYPNEFIHILTYLCARSSYKCLSWQSTILCNTVLSSGNSECFRCGPFTIGIKIFELFHTIKEMKKKLFKNLFILIHREITYTYTQLKNTFIHSIKLCHRYSSNDTLLLLVVIIEKGIRIDMRNILYIRI